MFDIRTAIITALKIVPDTGLENFDWIYQSMGHVRVINVERPNKNRNILSGVVGKCEMVTSDDFLMKHPAQIPP